MALPHPVIPLRPASTPVYVQDRESSAGPLPGQTLPSGLALVVEDDPHARKYIRMTLEKSGFCVLEAECGATALELFHQSPPVVALLDLGLPDTDGLDLCRELRESRADLGILILTGRGDDSDKVAALEQGADDYLVKPFGPEILVARVRAVLRRCGRPQPETEALGVDGIRLDRLRGKVYKRGQEVDLTPREHALLTAFLSHPGEVLTRERLRQEVWGENHHGSAKALDVLVCKLREKLEDDPSRPRRIRTEWGVGFVCS